MLRHTGLSLPTIYGGAQVSIFKVLQRCLGSFRQTQISVGQEDPSDCSSNCSQTQRPHPHPERLCLQAEPWGKHCSTKRQQHEERNVSQVWHDNNRRFCNCCFFPHRLQISWYHICTFHSQSLYPLFLSLTGRPQTSLRLTNQQDPAGRFCLTLKLSAISICQRGTFCLNLNFIHEIK